MPDMYNIHRRTWIAPLLC